MLKIDAEYDQGILFVRLNGSLNEKNSYKINNYLVPVIMKHNIKYLVFNLEALDNIDLRGRDAIINSKIAIKKNKGKILLCKVNNKIDNIFKGLRIPFINKEEEVLKFIEV